MADITIKRYDATLNSGSGGWVELNPKTEISQVNGLQTALNGKQATLTFDSTPTDSSTNPVTSGGVYTSIQNVVAIAEGKTETYTLKYDPTDTAHTYANSTFNSQSDSITISNSDYLYIEGGKVTGAQLVSALDLKIGDIIWVINTPVPDRWVGAISNGTYTLYKLETSTVDLANYLTNVAYDSSTHIISLTKNSQTSTVVDLDNFASISNGTITIGGNSITPLTSHQDLSAYAPLNSPTFTGTVTLPTTTKIGSLTTTGNVRYANGTLSVDTTTYVPATRTVNGKALSSDITLSASDVSALPSSTTYLASASLSTDSRTLTITTSGGSSISTDSGNITTLSSTAPSNAKTGDIWFATAS